MQRSFIVGCAWVTLAAPAFAVNKCVDADGKVVYQERACAASTRSEAITLQPTKEELAKAAHERQVKKAREAAELAEAQRGAEKARQSALAAAAAEESSRKRMKEFADLEHRCGGKVPSDPKVGMSEQQFRACTYLGVYGNLTVNETQTLKGVQRQYVVKDSFAGVRYVYTSQGVVTAIQR